MYMQRDSSGALMFRRISLAYTSIPTIITMLEEAKTGAGRQEAKKKENGEREITKDPDYYAGQCVHWKDAM